MNTVQQTAVEKTILQLYKDSSAEFQEHAVKTLTHFVECRNHGIPVKPSHMSFLNRKAWEVYNVTLKELYL